MRKWKRFSGPKGESKPIWACSSSVETEPSGSWPKVNSPKNETWSPRVPPAKMFASWGNWKSLLTLVVVPSSFREEVLTSASVMLTASGTWLGIAPGQMAWGQSFL
jgi:hypothetical protein